MIVLIISFGFHLASLLLHLVGGLIQSQCKLFHFQVFWMVGALRFLGLILHPRTQQLLKLLTFFFPNDEVWSCCKKCFPFDNWHNDRPLKFHNFIEKTKFALVWFSSKVLIRIESVLCCIFELLAEFFFATTSNSIQNTNLTDCQYTYSVADIAEYIQFIRRVIT